MNTLLALGAALLTACQPAPTPAQPSAPVQTPERAEPEIRTADDLLNALQAADNELRRLSAEIQIDRVFFLQGDRQIRRGKVFYEDSGPAKPESAPRVRTFGIRFNYVEIGKRIETEIYDVVFDGRWLVERRPAEKTFTKQEVVRPGEKADPMKLGEGRFPLPIGQQKEDILRRFQVTLAPALDGVTPNDPKDQAALERFVKDCRQLVLTPLPELNKEEFKEIRLWYSKDSGRWLPRMCRTVSRADDVTILQMLKFEVNQDFPSEVKEIMDTTAPKEGWNVDVRELPRQ